ncbi:MAG: CPBP family intramembrane metalloprotease [Nitrospinae bacterium]|nr:CPBP family intramembrane metalloprotease [Nitrospinota bacterium]MZH41774.1 CPBP family intramembrane metalloprotease [Nitrospinota bacterium]
MNILTPILVIYFAVVFPTIHLVFPGNRFIYEYWPTLYFSLALTIIILSKQVSAQQLGLKDVRKSVTIGLLLGTLPAISVPLLDSLLVSTGLSQSELFTGADMRSPDEMGFNRSLTSKLFPVIIVPFINQLFLTGLVIKNLLKTQNTGQAIISSGLLFCLFQFDFSLGNLFLGMVATGLLRLSGSVLAPVLIHAGFAIAEYLIVFHYPRLISALVFIV